MTPPSPLSFTILADDLTGAADAAAHAYGAGLPAYVSVFPPPELLPLAGALALTSASRSLSAARARDAVTRLVEVQGEGIWFKKIDSMMRGNVLVEVRALAETLGRSVVLLTPALPALGRTVRDGRLTLSQVARPITLSRVVRARTQSLSLDTIRMPRALDAVIAAAASSARPDTPNILLADAETDNDLRILAEAAMGNPARPLLAGSGAAAGALASVLAGGATEKSAETAVASWQDERVLVVIGSRSERAREQVAAAANLPGVVWRQVEVGQPDVPETCRALILTPPWRAEERLRPEPAQNLARIAAPLVESGFFTRVVVGGGATAEALLSRVQPGLLQVTALAGAGMPVLQPVDRARETMPSLVLKAGNHGAVDLVARWLYDSGRARNCV